MPLKLVGKTITKAYITGIKDCDDEPFLNLEFSDGTKATITAYYGGYTGKSYDENPCFINVSYRPM